MNRKDIELGRRVRYVGNQMNLQWKEGIIITPFPTVNFNGKFWGVSPEEIEYTTSPKIMDVLNKKI